MLELKNLIFSGILLLSLFFIAITSIRTQSEELDTLVEALKEPQMIRGYATAYCDHGITASGEETRVGICAAKREWIGKTVIIYQRLPGNKVGEMIGIWEIKDCGGTESLKDGKVIDIWCSDLEKCQEMMNRFYENGCKGHIFFQIVDAEG